MIYYRCVVNNFRQLICIYLRSEDNNKGCLPLDIDDIKRFILNNMARQCVVDNVNSIIYDICYVGEDVKKEILEFHSQYVDLL